MHLISVVVMAVALYTITAMFFSKRSPTLILVLGVLVAFLIANSVPDGMNTVIDEVGLRQSGVFGPKIWTVLVSVFAQTTWWVMITALIFLVIIGFSVERRTSNMKYCLLIFGGLILGVVSWCILVDDVGVMGGLTVAVSAIIGAGVALFARLRIFLPIVGDTKLQVWMLVMIWWIVLIAATLLEMSFDIALTVLLLHFMAFLFGFILGAIGRRKDVPWTLYRREAHIDPVQIERLCQTGKQKETYDHIMRIEDPFMRDAWIKILAKSLLCPQCGGKCRVISNKVVCDKGHYVSRSNEDEEDFIT